MSLDPAWQKLAADFAAEMSELRERRRLSYDELARRSGVSRTYLRDLGSGRRGRGLPCQDKVAAIAAALDVEADHFRVTRARAVIASPKVIDTVYERLRKPRAAA